MITHWLRRFANGGSEMGQTVTDDMRNKTAWDSNAITPGTPFMDLLATSLRYWVAKKLNTDPGWKGVRCNFSLSFFRFLSLKHK